MGTSLYPRKLYFSTMYAISSGLDFFAMNNELMAKEAIPQPSDRPDGGLAEPADSL